MGEGTDVHTVSLHMGKDAGCFMSFAGRREGHRRCLLPALELGQTGLNSFSPVSELK